MFPSIHGRARPMPRCLSAAAQAMGLAMLSALKGCEIDWEAMMATRVHPSAEAAPSIDLDRWPARPIGDSKRPASVVLNV